MKIDGEYIPDELAQEAMGNSRHDEKGEANARLIAAAPEMLSLLQELIDIEGPQPGTADWAGKVHAVIAKATGKTLTPKPPDETNRTTTP